MNGPSIKYFSSILCNHDSISKTILQGSLEGERRRESLEEMLDGKCQTGRACFHQNCSQWSPAAREKKKKKPVEEDFCWIVPRVFGTTRSVMGLNITVLWWLLSSHACIFGGRFLPYQFPPVLINFFNLFIISFHIYTHTQIYIHIYIHTYMHAYIQYAYNIKK